jgi:PhnB protein
MRAVNPYLNFPGNAEEAFALYHSVFGGELLPAARYADGPDGQEVPAELRRKILHICLALPNGSMLMGSDALPPKCPPVLWGNNTYTMIECDDEAEVARYFSKLIEAGGVVEMAPAKMFWNAFFACGCDRFGIRWMFNHSYAR